jgi:tetratricopeptide (TPR) repeat protein
LILLSHYLNNHFLNGGTENPEKIVVDAYGLLQRAEFGQVLERLDACSRLLGELGSSKASDTLLLRVLVLRGETELSQGQYASAKKMTEEALTVSKKIFGTQPGPDELLIVVTIASQLGECDYAIALYNEARALFMKVILSVIRVLAVTIM